MTITKNIIIILLLLPLFAKSQTSGAVQYPAHLNNYVSDFIDSVPAAVESHMNSAIAAFEKKSSVEVAVAVVPSLQGQSVDEYAIGMFNAWGVGKKATNNGLLILWAPRDRSYFACTGSGLEGDFPDAVVSRIERNVWLPELKSGNGARGLAAFVDSTLSYLDPSAVTMRQAQAEAQAHADAQARALTWSILTDVGIACIILGLLLYYLWRKRKTQNEIRLRNEAWTAAIKDIDYRIAKIVRDINNASAENIPTDRARAAIKLCTVSREAITQHDQNHLLELSGLLKDAENAAAEPVQLLETLISARNFCKDPGSVISRVMRYLPNRILLDELHGRPKSVWSGFDEYYGVPFDYQLDQIKVKINDLAKLISENIKSQTAKDLVLSISLAGKHLKSAEDYCNSIHLHARAISSVYEAVRSSETWLRTNSQRQLSNCIDGAMSACKQDYVESSTKRDLEALRADVKAYPPNPSASDPIREKTRVEMLIDRARKIKRKADDQYNHFNIIILMMSKTLTRYSDRGSFSDFGGGSTSGGGAGGQY